MTLFFLEESSQKNKYKLKVESMLNRINEQIEGDKVYLKLPLNKKVKQRKIKRVIKKIDKYNIKTAILSEKLYKIEALRNEIYSKNINILNGKYLFRLLIEEIVSYICEKSELKKEKIELSILINDLTTLNTNIMVDLAQKVKTLNIVTNHIEKFKSLEDYLYSEKGIIIKLSNNYKKALSKTNIIINMDFVQEMINKYYIPSKCIIVNIQGEIKIKSKKFNGININGYNIKIPKKYKIKGFNNKAIYESYVLNKEYGLARKQILEDKIQIKSLIGEKGEINSKEFSFLP